MDCCKFTLKVHFNTFILVFICSVFVTEFLEANATSPTDLDSRIQILLKNPSLKSVSYGISVVSIKKNT
ncbi:MAG TPA: hypothetical protein ACFYD9_04520, partial [Candidatus Wunengus sp. YC64]